MNNEEIKPIEEETVETTEETEVLDLGIDEKEFEVDTEENKESEEE